MNNIINVAACIISLYGAYISFINGRLPYKKEILDKMFLINGFLKGISEFSDDFNHDLVYVIFYSVFKNNDTDLNDIYNLNLNGKYEEIEMFFNKEMTTQKMMFERIKKYYLIKDISTYKKYVFFIENLKIEDNYKNIKEEAVKLYPEMNKEYESLNRRFF